MKRMALLAAAAALTVLLAGCGGSKVYTLTPTKSCLMQRGAQIRDKALDFVAQTATGGAFVTVLNDNSVTIVFGGSADNGQQLEDAYEHFAFANVRAGLPDVLKRYNNAVTLWHKHPQQRDLTLVVGCLR